MNFLNYFLISIVAYLGIIAGIVISYMAKEELKDGKKYFFLGHNIILAFILYFFLEFLEINAFITLSLPLILVALLFYIDITKKSWITYIFLGIIFYIASRNSNFLLLESGLIFIYGVFTGSLLLNLRQKNYLGIITKNLMFFLCLILFFI